MYDSSETLLMSQIALADKRDGARRSLNAAFDHQGLLELKRLSIIAVNRHEVSRGWFGTF